MMLWQLNSLPHGKIFMLFCRLMIFIKINFLDKFFQEYNLSVKQIRSRSGLMWVQSVCKGYELCNELNSVSNKIYMGKSCSEILQMPKTSRPDIDVILTFIMLNSTDHELYPAILKFINMIKTTSEDFKASNLFLFFNILLYK